MLTRQIADLNIYADLTEQEQIAMTDQQIREYYDINLNLTLSELSRITGKTKAELKRILMQ